MRFATRTFVASFVPFVVLLAVSFWVVRAEVVSTVRDGLRRSTRDQQLALSQEQTRDKARTRRLLSGIADNPTLKAGLQLLSTERNAQEAARNTVRDQLSEIADGLDYDLMIVSGVASGNADGPLAAVVREAGGFVPLHLSLNTGQMSKAGQTAMSEQGFYRVDDRLYELTSVPINEDGAQVAVLSVGGRFEISRLGTPAVLLNGSGKVVTAAARDLAPAYIESALAACSPDAECTVKIQDQTYLSLPLNLPLRLHQDDTGAATSQAKAPRAKTAETYTLRSLQNVDAASASVQSVIQRLFVVAGFLALGAALGIGALSSRSVARPLTQVAARLRECSATGELPEFPEVPRGGLRDVLEVRELTRGFNVAAKAVHEGRERLTRAYVDFVGSMAQALDARDSYTAGHSRRVSEYACAIARAMGLPSDEIEQIRIGALLHDVGKIGISDLVLQKPGRLTDEETLLIRRHPAIGRRILEKVHGMEPYLDMVELHHENWDGTGYPRGLKQEETPLQARIVKVADGYDAMTSDRPYRRGMTHAEALAILRKVAGTETDVTVVEAFAGLGDLVKEQEVKQSVARQRIAEANESLRSLAGMVGEQSSSQAAPVLKISNVKVSDVKVSDVVEETL